MGRIKQLLPLNNEPSIRFCLHRILDAGIAEVVVVLGSHREKIEPFLADLPVTIVDNDRCDSEMADSVRVGREALSNNATGVMIHPADQPLVRPETYKLVADTHTQHPEHIIVPTCDGRGGHPTLFPASLLQQSKRSEPLNLFMRRNHERVKRIAIDDLGVVMDMDYQREYDQLVTFALHED
jgi:CTP:molybdopterin cytidylyltransferase MocA